MARPSTYTPELAEKICGLIESGLSERAISKMDGMPDTKTIGKWKDDHPEFLRQSARAREESAAIFDDKNVEIALTMEQIAQEHLEEGKSIPKGVIEAYKLIMQENARQAGLRNDALFGDRKTVKLETGNGSEGLAAFYREMQEANKDESV